MSMLVRRRSTVAAMSATMLLIGMTVPAAAVYDDESAAPDQARLDDVAPEHDVFAEESESGLWMVRLDEAPLASYQGEISGLSATSPEVTGDDRLDADSPAGAAYLSHLADSQDEALASIEEALGRDVTVAFEYRAALNGLAVEASADEAAVIADLADVTAVTPDEVHEIDTDVSNALISSPAIWSGETAAGVGTRGEGVIVGMLDTGVNADHPSFAATDGEGYTHTNPFGSGTYVGVCDSGSDAHDDLCNDKLIGAWDYTGTDARDEVGHGSHTGSTIAGNTHVAAVSVGEEEVERTIQGVAPRANVISYKVCTEWGCLSSASVAAVDQAVLDGVDVLNYSISGGDRPWNDSVDLAFLGAFEAGVFIAASAGNTGPGEGTVAKTAPWNAAVAATSHQRVIANVLDVTGPAPVPEELTGIVAVLGDGSPFAASVEAPIRFAGPVDSESQGCEPFEADAFDGAIALIQRGGCNFAVKIDNAADAGAVAVVVFNQFAGPPIVMGEVGDTTVPGLMISNDDGVALRDLLLAGDGAPVTARLGIEATVVLNDGWADIVTDFSARGPSQYDLLAPTFAAPGRNILAATAASGDDPVQYEIMQGTSMSSPHGAGAGALLKALHPQWSPAAIRSALAMSAHREGLVKEDGATPADPFDVGSGRLDLAAAGQIGLTLDETHAGFIAADPAAGGDPKTLNLPAVVNQACDESCTWTRTFTSVADVPVTYSVSAETPAGIATTVTPSTFSVDPGATQSVEIALDVSGVVGGDWVFGSVEVTTDDAHAGGAPVADVHLPIAVVPAEAFLTVDPATMSSLQDVAQTVTQPLTITNTGTKALTWQLDTESEGCTLPPWASVSPGAGTVAAGAEAVVEVTFDSADMTAGDYPATLCLESNDPHQPTTNVALALTVVEIPVVDVADGAVLTHQPVGTVTGTSFAISNDGYGELAWTLDDEDAGPSPERIALLREGVLLAPNSSTGQRAVMAFDPDSGALIDPEFIPYPAFEPGTSLYTPVQVLAKLDGTGFLVADQVRSVITEYDLSGDYRGIFAPAGGPDPAVMSNIRSMTWSPDGTLLVTVAAQVNTDSVIELDADGNYLGQFIPAGLDGLDSPWDVLVRDHDVLVSASDSDAIHSYSLDGTTANERFVDGIPWAEQMVELNNGNVLTVNWGGGTGSAVHEYDGEGNEVGRYVADGSAYTGVHPLGNGNIIVSTGDGAFEIDRAGTVLENEFDDGRVRYFTEVRMPEAQACSTPDEVPWLDVSTSSGSVPAGSADQVTVTLNSTGLEPGEYRTQLCVTSDDPDMPLVTIPVQLTVTDAVCAQTVTGEHAGPLLVQSGLTCLAHGSSVSGPVTVEPGGSIFAYGANVAGPLRISGAEAAQVYRSTVSGPIAVTRSTRVVTFTDNYVQGPVQFSRNVTDETPIVVSGNHVTGPLSCSRNSPTPVNDGVPNEVTGPRSGQCAGL